MGVLADIKSQPAGELLEKAMERLKESRKLMDSLYAKFGDMRNIEQHNKAIPEHTAALDRILKALPPVERVSLVNSRFANVSQGSGVVFNYGPVGSNFDEMLANMQADLLILEKEYDQTIEAFEAVLPAARQGGFAAIVLSGRAPLPEKIMHSIDQTMVYVHSVDRACQASIAADMQVYPKGLDWLPKANWKGLERQSQNEARPTVIKNRRANHPSRTSSQR
jgi:hypothetical protein